MSGKILLVIIVLWPLVAGMICYMIGRVNKSFRDFFVVSSILIESFLLLFLWYDYLSVGEEIFILKEFGVNGLYFKIDGFRLLYVSVTIFLWLMAAIFSKEYFEHYRNRNRYYLFYLLTLGATIGVFLSDDLFTLFLFFELMSFTSYPLVAHDENKDSLRAAGTYLAVAVIGGLLLLMGMFLLYNITSTMRFDEIFQICGDVLANGTAKEVQMLFVAGILLLFGFGAKAGMVPLHIWLPKAHPVAPAPASALLSGILTKTGIFGILFVGIQMFYHNATFGKLVLVLGLITMLLGAVLALFSINIKRILACSSMSQIGFILVGIGMQGILGHHNAIAVRGTVLHMVNHSLLKLVLFLAAGVIAMNLHALDLNSVRGFGKGKPALFFAFLMASLGIGGIPLWNGYISKALLHESIVEYIQLGENPLFFQIAEILFLVAGGITIAYMLKLFIALFFESSPDSKPISKNKPYLTKKSGFVLIGTSLLFPLFGMLPNLFLDKIGVMGEGLFHNNETNLVIHYFSYANIKGSLMSIAIGILLYCIVVRKVLMKKQENGQFCYMNRIPIWFDLEQIVYRPLLIVVLPSIFGGISMVIDKMTDQFILIMKKRIFRPLHKETKEPLLHLFSRKIEKYKNTNKLIESSMAFGLMMIFIGLCFTLLYLVSKLVLS